MLLLLLICKLLLIKISANWFMNQKVIMADLVILKHIMEVDFMCQLGKNSFALNTRKLAPHRTNLMLVNRFRRRTQRHELREQRVTVLLEGLENKWRDFWHGRSGKSRYTGYIFLQDWPVWEDDFSSWQMALNTNNTLPIMQPT